MTCILWVIPEKTLLGKKGSDLLPGMAFHSDRGFQSLKHSWIP